jgi:hypothetical protein
MDAAASNKENAAQHIAPETGPAHQSLYTNHDKTELPQREHGVLKKGSGSVVNGVRRTTDLVHRTAKQRGDPERSSKGYEKYGYVAPCHQLDVLTLKAYTGRR